jgi:hypothetical protein
VQEIGVEEQGKKVKQKKQSKIATMQRISVQATRQKKVACREQTCRGLTSKKRQKASVQGINVQGASKHDKMQSTKRAANEPSKRKVTRKCKAESVQKAFRDTRATVRIQGPGAAASIQGQEQQTFRDPEQQ